MADLFSRLAPPAAEQKPPSVEQKVPSAPPPPPPPSAPEPPAPVRDDDLGALPPAVAAQCKRMRAEGADVRTWVHQGRPFASVSFPKEQGRAELFAELARAPGWGQYSKAVLVYGWPSP
jgi:hypothetical protein